MKRKRMLALILFLVIATAIVFSYRWMRGNDFFQIDGGHSEQEKNEAESGAEQNVSKVEEEIEVQEEEERKENVPSQEQAYPWHRNISVTIFWAGESASDDNRDISNKPSAWRENWSKDFGGRDDPEKRNGYYPKKFIPKENPFYFALPFNDFDNDGKRKSGLEKIIPWAKEMRYGRLESMCKNRWIKIVKGSKATYAQWEDVGPFREDDEEYVFGKSQPRSQKNKNAGLDVSPAVRDYLELKDIDKVDWQFVEESGVPEGPWKKIITRSQIDWD